MAYFQPNRLYVSSEDRVSGTHNNFEVQLPASIMGAKHAEVKHTSLPYLAPPIPPYENTLYLNVYNTATSTLMPQLRTTIDTSVNYSMSGLVAALNSAMTLLTDGTTTYDLSTNIVWSLIASQNVAESSKISFQCTDVVIQFAGVGTKGSTYWNNLSYRLGYPQRSNTYTPYNAANYYINTAAYVAGGNVWAYPSLLRTSNVYILSDLTTGDNVGTNGEFNILCKVPVSHLTVFGDTLTNDEDTVLSHIPPSISRIRFRLVDDEGKPFNIPDDGQAIVCIEIAFAY